jgi:hypothetical protein
MLTVFLAKFSPESREALSRKHQCLWESDDTIDEVHTCVSVRQCLTLPYLTLPSITIPCLAVPKLHCITLHCITSLSCSAAVTYVTAYIL